MREALERLLRPAVEDSGYELWELEFAPRAKGGLLRLYIDSADGITLEDCERVSRAVSSILDAEDPIPGQYTLEVSSPGLDRVLRTSAHFERYVGERVRIEMSEPVNGRRRFLGHLVNVADGTVELRIDEGSVELPIAGMHKARLAPEL